MNSENIHSEGMDRKQSPSVPATSPSEENVNLDGSALLDELRDAICRYLIMSSPEATDAVVLWIAATHAQPAWEHATRLTITGPAKRCGKSRLLEIIKFTSNKALPVVNASVAAIYRSIGSDDPPTILFDEADAIFGTKRQAEANEDLRALLNAGHSRGWPILRCSGPNQEVTSFASFAMAALAGIGDLPDTITDRAVNIRMRRRAPSESVQPFRIRRDSPALTALRDQIHHWIGAHQIDLRNAEPDMPVEDRAADTWESLIAVADLAGGNWPERSRSAAKILTNNIDDAETCLSIRLLADLRDIFANNRSLYTTTILEHLRGIDSSPWTDRDFSSHDLAKMLRPYGVKPTDVRENGGANRKGYYLADLNDAFVRYLKS